MENLPIVRIENLSGVNDSMDISHENVIIEEGAFQITQAECQDRGGLLCMSRPDLIGPPKLMSMYETVTIYEAFNSFTHSSSNQILNEYVSNESHSRTPNMNKSKRFKIKILDPIKSSSDFVQNLNEGKIDFLGYLAYFTQNNLLLRKSQNSDLLSFFF